MLDVGICFGCLKFWEQNWESNTDMLKETGITVPKNSRSAVARLFVPQIRDVLNESSNQ